MANNDDVLDFSQWAVAPSQPSTEPEVPDFSKQAKPVASPKIEAPKLDDAKAPDFELAWEREERLRKEAEDKVSPKKQPRAGLSGVDAVIDRAARQHGVDGTLLRTFAEIESGGRPGVKTGSYKGLMQLSNSEFAKYGGTGDIYDADANAAAGARKLKAESDQFRRQFGRDPTGPELYMIHQQGWGGAQSHWANPDRPAWESMYATAEGRSKGPKWAKAAIWGNVPDDVKRRYGSVENMTSRDFTNMWADKYNRIGSRFGVTDAQAPPETDNSLLKELMTASPDKRLEILERKIEEVVGGEIPEFAARRRARAQRDAAALDFSAFAVKPGGETAVGKAGAPLVGDSVKAGFATNPNSNNPALTAKEKGVFGDAWGILTPEQRRLAGEDELATAKKEVEFAKEIQSRMKRHLDASEARPEQSALDWIMKYHPAQLWTDTIAKIGNALGGAYEESQTKRIKTAEDALAGKAPLPSKTGSRAFVENTLRSTGEIVPSVMKYLGQAGNYAGQLAQKLTGNKVTGKAEETAAYKYGEDLQKWLEGKFPGDQARQQQFTQQVAQGVGSTVGFWGPGAIARLIGAGEKGYMAAIALSGIAMQSSQAYEEVAKKINEGTATEQDQIINWLAGVPLGGSEALPFAPTIGGPLSTWLKGRVAGAIEQGIEETVQEVGQNVGQNVVAKKTYDPERNVLEGVPEAAAVALVTGLGGGAALKGNGIADTGQGEGEKDVPSTGELVPKKQIEGEEQKRLETEGAVPTPPPLPEERKLEDQNGKPPPGGPAQTKTASEREIEILRREGWQEDDIAQMGDEERAAHVADALAQQGTGLAEDEPTAEPIRDLKAQAADLRDPQNGRAAVWLPKASAEALARDKAASKEVLGSGVVVEDFDGNGGTLVARDEQAAQDAIDRRESGVPIQTIVGEMTGSGTGKLPNADTVVQQVTKDGAVVRETAVPADQAEAAAEAFAAPDRDVWIGTLSDALTRRDEAAAEDVKKVGSRGAPVDLQTAEDVAAAGQRVIEPSQKQAEAGNYPKGHVRFQGLEVSIETPKGGTRRGYDESGNQTWEVPDMPAAYGYFKGVPARAKDKEHVDVFIGDDVQSPRAFIIDQYDTRTGEFDEPKVVIGATNRDHATSLYDRSFSDGLGPQRRSFISEVAFDELKNWLQSGDATKPFAQGARAVEDPRIQNLAEYSGQDAQSEQSVLPQLRGEGDQNGPRVGAEFSGVSEGGGTAATPASDLGSQGQQSGVRSGQRPLDQPESASAQYAEEQAFDAQGTDSDPDGVGRGNRSSSVDTPVSAQAGRNDGRSGAVDAPASGATTEGNPLDFSSQAVAPLARYDGEPLSDMEIDAIVDSWRYVQEMSRKRRPQALTNFVIENGGLNDAAGEVRHIAGSAQERPGLISRNGQDLDDMALRAWESGFLPGDRPTVSEFLDALDDDLMHGNIVREGDLAALEDFKYADEIAQELADYGVNTSRFRSENSLRDYFGQERKGAARQVEEGEEAQAAAEVGEGEAGSAAVEEAPYELAQKPEDFADYVKTGEKPSKSDAKAPEVSQSGTKGEPDAEQTSALDGLSLDQLRQIATKVGTNWASAETPKQVRQRIMARVNARTDGADALQRAVDEVTAITTEASGQTSLVPPPTTKEEIDAASVKKGEKTEQKPMDEGLFGSGKDQMDLVDMAKQPAKTPGQIAYEEDVRRKPTYQDGGKRPSWDQLDDAKKATWEKNPTARGEATKTEALTNAVIGPEPTEAVERPSGNENALRDRIIEGGFKDIREARKFARANGFAEATDKEIDEAIEVAVVAAAKVNTLEYSAQRTEREMYRRMVQLYDNQPNLGVRTGTSMANQAYSTPMPLAYLAARLAGTRGADVVYEPTAGNGALLIDTIAPGKVFANELDTKRAAALKAQGYRTTALDATDPGQAKAIRQTQDGADSVIMNPPFGAVREDGRSKSWQIDDFKTTTVDHAIALTALEAMHERGKAVLILGGINATDVDERRKGYRGQAKRQFFTRLYRDYNVVDHFTVSGDLYKKQGAGWPVDVVVIDGRGKSGRPLPAAQPPAIFDSWDALEGKLPNADAQANEGTAREDRRPDAGPDRAESKPVRGNADGGAKAGSGRSGGRDADVKDEPDAVRGNRDRGQPGDVRPGEGAARDDTSGTSGKRGRTDRPAPAPRRERVAPPEGSGQALYEPTSEATSLDALVPSNMAHATKSALSRIAKKNGGVDKFVASALDYDVDELSDYFSAEQVDAIAAAIDNIGNGDGFIIGDQCVAGHTRVYDPETGTFTAIKVLAERKRPIRVLALTPKGFVVASATAPFRKGEADLYRVVLDDGREITVTRQHRFLTPDGWRTLDDGLRAGHSLASAEGHLLNNLGARPLVHRADDPRSIGTVQGYLDGCSAYPYRDDAQLHAAQGGARGSVPSPADVLEHIRCCSPLGEWAVSQGHSHRYQDTSHRSRSSSSPWVSRVPSPSDSQDDASRASMLLPTPRNAPPTHGAQALLDREDVAILAGLSAADASGSSVTANGAQRRSCAGGRAPFGHGQKVQPRFAVHSGHPDTSSKSDLCDLSLEDHTGWRRIVSITHVGHDEFFDMWVPGFENYMAEGLVNHNTGIGKGRVVAAMIRYATIKGWTPVFVTEKPDLYGDMFRDMADIGLNERLGREPRVFMTNTAASVPLDEKALEWKNEYDEWAMARDEVSDRLFGEKYSKLKTKEQREAVKAEFDKPKPKQAGRFLKTGTNEKQLDEMAAIANGTANYDAVFTTYDQMNNPAKAPESQRRRFLRQVIPNSLLILDESHNAGGQGDKGWRSNDATDDRATFVRDMVQQAKGVMYSSATFAKRPDVMDLYARTDMGKAVDDPKKLPELIQRGGVPMQQIVATMLSDAGQYMRRERSFEGVEYSIDGVPVEKDAYKQFTSSVRSIFEFDKAVEEMRGEFMQDVLDGMGATIANDAGVGQATAHSTNFSSIMHNVINQMLLSITSDQVADKAIESYKNGEKPIIALSNTMESFVGDYAEELGLKPGDTIDISFGDVLRRYLARTLRITVKDADGNKSHIQIPIKALPSSLKKMYDEAERLINEGVYTLMPVSPIDWVRHRLGKAGISVAEVTGRSLMIDYSGNAPTLVDRPKNEAGPAGKRSSISKFNNGRLDALILNRSGSTGVSMHASEKFKDKRRRRMIIQQADPNVDVHLQMLGRVHRTGQVIPPVYSQIAAEIPASARPTAVLMKKMASLNANTTGARGSVFMADAVDFMNEVGDKIVATIVADDWEIEAALGHPLKENDKGIPMAEDAARRVTGRLVLLEPEQQAALLDRIQSEYTAEIERLDAMGENTLEAKTVDLQAKVLDEVVLRDKQGDGPFLDASYMQKVSVKAQGRAMAPEEIADKIAKAIDVSVPGGGVSSALQQLEQQGRVAMNAKVTDINKRVREWIASEVAKASDETKVSTRDRHNKTLSRWNDLTRIVAPGARVVLDMKQGQMSGIVLSVERTGKTKNLSALGAWQVVVAVPDSVRTITFPMSKLFTDANPKGEEESGATIAPSRVPLSGILSQMEDARREGREERYIVTGNILAGYEQVMGRGRIINFTMEDGTLRPGILMGRDFVLDKFMEKRAIRFKSADQIVTFMTRAPNAQVRSTDRFITLSRPAGAWQIDMPSGRATGGRYFTDKRVLEAIKPHEFRRVAGIMTLRLYDVSTFKAAVEEMRRIGALFETTEDQEVAQEVARQGLPQTQSKTPEATSEAQQAASRTINEFRRDVDALKERTGVETRKRSFGSDSEPLSAATGLAVAMDMKKTVSEVKSGSRLNAMAKLIAQFGADATDASAMIDKAASVDVKAASLDDLRTFVSAMDDLVQVMEARAQDGWQMIDDVEDLGTEFEGALEKLGERFDEISSAAQDQIYDLELLEGEISERYDDLAEERFGGDEDALEAWADAQYEANRTDRLPTIIDESQFPDAQETLGEVLSREVALGDRVLARWDEAAKGVLARIDPEKIETLEQADAALSVVSPVLSQLRSVAEWMDKHWEFAQNGVERIGQAIEAMRDEQLRPAVDKMEENQGRIQEIYDAADLELFDRETNSAASATKRPMSAAFSQVKAGGAVDQFDAIEQAIMAGKSYDVPFWHVSDQIEAIRPLSHMFPNGTLIGVLHRVDPAKSKTDAPEDQVVKLHFRTPDGKNRTMHYFLAKLQESRALAFPSGFLGPRPGFLAINLTVGKNTARAVSGEVWHEAFHILRREGLIGGDRWARLLRHAKKLRVFDMGFKDVLEKINDPTAEWCPEKVTLRQVYSRLYEGRDDRVEVMHQEEITHMLELWYHGALTDADTEPVRDILDDMATGKIAGNPVRGKNDLDRLLFEEGYFAAQESPSDQDELGYYSALLRAAHGLKQEKGTPEQLFGALTEGGTRFMKEARSIGLVDFIEAMGPERYGKKPSEIKITKRDLIDFIKKNRIVVREVVRRASAMSAPEKAERIGELEQEWARLATSMFGFGEKRHAERIATIKAEIAAISADKTQKTMFQNYTLDPRGKSYEEVIVHMPSKSTWQIVGHPDRDGYSIIDNNGDYIRAADGTVAQWYSDYDAERYGLAHYKNKDWRAGHFDEVNQVGHLMASVAQIPSSTTVEDDLAYVLHQIQSDWGQQIRKSHPSIDPVIDELAEAITASRLEEIESVWTLLQKDPGEVPAGATDDYWIELGYTGDVDGYWDFSDLSVGAKYEVEASGSVASAINGLETRRDQGEEHIEILGRSFNVSDMLRELNSLEIVRPVASLEQVPWGFDRPLVADAKDIARRAIERLQGRAQVANMSDYEYVQWFASERDRLSGELAQHRARRKARGNKPLSHELVETTDQWVTTMLRRALTKAVDAGLRYIAIPSGDTVLSYNPGKREGMNKFYGSFKGPYRGVVQTNMLNILRSLDKKSPPPSKIEKLLFASHPEPMNKSAQYETQNDDFGYTVFAITDKVRQRVKAEGLPLFAATGIGADIKSVGQWLEWAENLSNKQIPIKDRNGKPFTIDRQARYGSITYTVKDGRKTVGRFYVRTGGTVPGSISVMNAMVEDDYQRRGIASAVYDAIEADTKAGGRPLYPQGRWSLSPDGRAFWQARDPAKLAEMDRLEDEPGYAYGQSIRVALDRPAQDRLKSRIQDAIRIVRRIAGPDVHLDFKSQIPARAARQGVEDMGAFRDAGLVKDFIGGFYRPETAYLEALIGLSVEAPGFDLRTAAGHEAWHHVERVFATDAELRVLYSRAEQGRMTKLAAQELGLDPENARDAQLLAAMPPVEITAYAFQRYRRLREEGIGSIGGLHIAVRRLFDRLQAIFKSIRAVVKGEGLTFEKIFETARSGEMAKRAPRAAQGQGRVAASSVNSANLLAQSLPRIEDIIQSVVEKAANTNDSIATHAALFVDQYLTFEAGQSTMSGEMYDAYKIWAKNAGVEAGDEQAFHRALIANGGLSRMKIAGRSRYIGVRIASKLGRKVADANALMPVEKRTLAQDIAQGFSFSDALTRLIDGVKRRFAGGADEAGKVVADVNRLMFLRDQVASSNDNDADKEVADNVYAMFDSPDVLAMAVPGAPGPRPMSWLERRARRMFDRVAQRSDAIRVRMQDKALPIKRLAVERVEAETATEVPVSLDTYLKEALYSGRAGERMVDLEQDYIEPLVEFMRDEGISLEGLGDYLYARHARERNDWIALINPDMPDGGSGMTNAEADQILADVRASGKQRAMDEAARRIDKMIEKSRKDLLKAGLIDRETFDNWSQKYAAYVPLRGFDIGEDENPDFPRVGRGFDVRGREAFQALGRRSKADNPVIYAVQQAQQAIVRAEKNRVNKTLYNAVKTYPNDSFWKVYNGEVRRRFNPSTGLVEEDWVPPQFVRRDDVIGVKLNGKQKWVELKHPDLARAMRGVGSDVAGSAIGRAAHKVMRTYAGLLTSYNPEFVVSNFFRDVQTAVINATGLEDKPIGLRRQIAKDALSTAAIRGALAAIRGTNARTASSQKYARYYEEFRLAGGKVSFIEFNDVERIRNKTLSALEAGRVRRGLRAAMESVENLNAAVENGVRLSTYAALRDAGMSQDQAAFIAKELTVNFNRKGEWGPGINALYLFFNASVQGITRMARAIATSSKVRYALGGLLAFGAMLDLLNYLAAGDDDDGENRYDKIPHWVKERNLIIMNPLGYGNYLMIPLPYGYNTPFLAGQEAMRVIRGVSKPGEAAGRVLLATLEAFNPMGSAGSFLQYASPTLLDPAVQIMENRNWFGGRISPKKFDDREPDSQLYFDSAPTWAKEVARIMNEKSGGNIGRPGWADFSPETIEHWAEFAGGGTAKFFFNSIATAERFVDGEEWLPEKTPVVRRVYGRQDSVVSRKREFYDAWADVDQAHYEVKALAKDGDREALKAARETYAPELRAYNAMKGARKQLKTLREAKTALEARTDLDAATKRQRLEDIAAKEKLVVMRSLKVYEDAKKQK